MVILFIAVSCVCMLTHLKSFRCSAYLLLSRTKNHGFRESKLLINQHPETAARTFYGVVYADSESIIKPVDEDVGYYTGC